MPGIKNPGLRWTCACAGYQDTCTKWQCLLRDALLKLPVFRQKTMTGRIYLGPMTTGLIFIMILISNTVIYLPL